MKKLIIGLTLLTSLSSLAGSGFVENSTPEIEEEGICKTEAVQNLLSFALDNGVSSFNTNLIRLVDNDKSFYSPSYYSWYELDVIVSNGEKTIRTLVQKDSLSGDCI